MLAMYVCMSGGGVCACYVCMYVCQEVEFVLAPGQELYSLKFDVVFTNNVALSYFIGEMMITSALNSRPTV